MLQSQAYEWWVKIAKGASPKDAPAKLPTQDPKYDTLAGNDGVWFWSDPVPVEKGKAYWLMIDARGPGEIMVWLVGYPEKPSTAFGADAAAFQEALKEKTSGKPPPQKRGREPFLHTYDWKGQLKTTPTNEWKTFARREMPFRPTANTPNVRWMRVVIMPYWPPGEYFVGNVRLTEYQEKEKR